MNAARPARQPAYRRQKNRRGRDRAFVELDGRRHYLGAYDSPESRQRYHALLAEWEAHGRAMPPEREALTVTELLAAFADEADRRYRQPDGSVGREAANFRPIIAALDQLYGRLPAASFTPRQLKGLRQHLVRERGWCRQHANRQMVRVRTIFRWAVGEGLVDPAVIQTLQAVDGLRSGEAPDSDPIRALGDEEIAAVAAQVSPVVADMIYVQLHTAMRPGELCAMRPRDLDLSGEVWLYRPAHHKNAHRGMPRVIALGPRAQERLRPYLSDRPLDAYLFCPADAERQRRAEQSQSRRTPRSCGNRAGTNRRAHPAQTPGERYTPVTYARAVRRGCEAAFPPPEPLRRRRVPSKRRTGRWETERQWRQRLGEARWAELQRWQKAHRWTPNQLRHTAATRIEAMADLETARTVLGHALISTTEKYYVQRDLKRAVRVMAEAG